MKPSQLFLTEEIKIADRRAPFVVENVPELHAVQAGEPAEREGIN
jgi:hypothetical protein